MLSGLLRWNASSIFDSLRALRPGPAASPSLEQLATATAALACRQPLRVDLRVAAVLTHARGLLTALAASLPYVNGERPDAESGKLRLAARLWARLSALPATAVRIAALDAALVLMADHELATSTLAGRVAASTRADPFGVVLAGLGALRGPLHGKAALAAHEMLLEAASAPVPELAVARVLASTGSIPGFGHPVIAAWTRARSACSSGCGHSSSAAIVR
jgi:citrate synthase